VRWWGLGVRTRRAGEDGRGEARANTCVEMCLGA
jgi:hypothetical protein